MPKQRIMPAISQHISRMPVTMGFSSRFPLDRLCSQGWIDVKNSRNQPGLPSSTLKSPWATVPMKTITTKVHPVTSAVSLETRAMTAVSRVRSS